LSCLNCINQIWICVTHIKVSCREINQSLFWNLDTHLFVMYTRPTYIHAHYMWIMNLVASAAGSCQLSW
jgi:hypothetical protein